MTRLRVVWISMAGEWGRSPAKTLYGYNRTSRGVPCPGEKSWNPVILGAEGLMQACVWMADIGGWFGGWY